MRNKGNIMERRIRLRTINSYITCFLCKGYLIDATTITECLHTFCKSCLVQHLREHVTCPRCENVIHQSHPLNYISHDRTMQTIVYKLVPHLQQDERTRHEEYCVEHGLPMPNANAANEEEEETPETKPNTESNNTSVAPAAPPPEESQDFHRCDEQVNLYLDCHSTQLKALKRKFIRCSSHATITHLKKFLAMKIFSSVEKYKNVDITLNNEILGKDHTLKFIWVTRWRVKQPLELQYRPKVQL